MHIQACKSDFDWIAADLAAFAQGAGDERNSHISTLITKLQIFRGIASERALSLDSFTYEDLRARPSTVYIRYPQEDAAAFGRLTTVFFDALFTRALSSPRKADEYPILVVLDEFRDLERIPNLIPLLSKGAGAGISAYIAIQDISNLKARYPGDEYKAILNNCEYWIIPAQIDRETMQMVSALIGEAKQSQHSAQKNTAGFTTGKTESERRTAFIPAEVLGAIPFGQQLIIAHRHTIRPILADAVFWDQTPGIRRQIPKEHRRST